MRVEEVKLPPLLNSSRQRRPNTGDLLSPGLVSGPRTVAHENHLGSSVSPNAQCTPRNQGNQHGESSQASVFPNEPRLTPCAARHVLHVTGNHGDGLLGVRSSDVGNRGLLSFRAGGFLQRPSSQSCIVCLLTHYLRF